MNTFFKSYSILLFFLVSGVSTLTAQQMNTNDASLVSSMENISFLITKSQSGSNFTDAEYFNEGQVQQVKGNYTLKLKVNWKDIRTGQKLSVAGIVLFDENHCNRKFNLTSNSAGVNTTTLPSELGCLRDHESKEGMRPGRSFRRVVRSARQN